MMNALPKLLRDACAGILELIYPPHCLVCREAGDDYLCAQCIEEIDLIEPPYCRKCGIPCESHFCRDCREREFAFEFSCSAGAFDGVLREAIFALKYQARIVMADPLADLMVRCFPQTHLAKAVDVVVPIPIHHSRFVERGFNQAEELARRFCKRVSLPLEVDALYKPGNTAHQVSLPRRKRMVNMKGAFAVKNANALTGKRVLLIDDVFTTGSTLDEAARILKANGAAQVYAYTLAKAL